MKQLWSLKSTSDPDEVAALLEQEWEPFAVTLEEGARIYHLRLYHLDEEGVSELIEETEVRAKLEGVDLEEPECKTCIYFTTPARRMQTDAGETFYMARCKKHGWQTKHFDTCDDHESEGIDEGSQPISG